LTCTHNTVTPIVSAMGSQNALGISRFVRGPDDGSKELKHVALK